MWEKTREDGSRRLRLNAIPTLFAFTVQKEKRKPPVRRDFIPKSVILEQQCFQTLEKINVTNIIPTKKERLSFCNTLLDKQPDLLSIPACSKDPNSAVDLVKALAFSKETASSEHSSPQILQKFSGEPRIQTYETISRKMSEHVESYRKEVRNAKSMKQVQNNLLHIKESSHYLINYVFNNNQVNGLGKQKESYYIYKVYEVEWW